MAQSLGDLIRRPLSRRVIDEIVFDTSAKGDARTCLLTSIALIEAGLERHLKSRMRRLNSNDERSLFGPRGSFGGVAAKVRSAYALGLIGPRTRSDLLALNEMRNVFAHAPYSVKFRWNRRLQSRAQGIKLFERWRSWKRELSSEQCLVEVVAFCTMLICRDRPKRQKPAPYQFSFLGYKTKLLQE
jgi:hypothetical protein